MRKRLLTPLLGCLSFATLCTLNLWHDIGRLQIRSVYYFRSAPPGQTLFLGTMALVLALTVVFFLLHSAALLVKRPLAARAIRLAFMLAFLFPIFLLHYVVLYSDVTEAAGNVARAVVFACYGAVIAAAAWYLVARDEGTVSAVANLNLLVSPLFLVLLASHAAWVWWSAPPAAEFTPRTPMKDLRALRPDSQRIIWLIFDEFDFRRAFSRRFEGVRLPELDRLRQQSLFGTNAYPPHEQTLSSMPALINGHSYREVRVAGVNLLELRDSPNDSHFWGSPETVFAKTRAIGARAGVVGWLHPYCRIFGDVLSECTFVPATKFVLLVREAHAQKLGVARTAWYLLLTQLELLPLAPRGLAPDIEDIARQEQLSEFMRIHSKALEYASNPSLDLVLAHYPIPHPYGIYDRKSGRFAANPASSYVDNLALVDRVVGELRRALEREGLWDRTAIIVSSDHSLRREPERLLPGRPWARGQPGSGLERIPFIVRLPGDAEGREYGADLNTIITAQLIVALTEGRIRNLQQLEAWLHGTSKPPGG